MVLLSGRQSRGSDATSAKYYGWYYPSYPAGEDVYLPVDSDSQEVPTYYISEAAYTLTPGTGDYDFVPGGTEEKYVQVDKIYYKGGYTNADWLKRYVFHLELPMKRVRMIRHGTILPFQLMSDRHPTGQRRFMLLHPVVQRAFLKMPEISILKIMI